MIIFKVFIRCPRAVGPRKSKLSVHPWRPSHTYVFLSSRQSWAHNRSLPVKIRILNVALACLLLTTCLLLPVFSLAQEGKLKLPEFRSLADKATESVNISLSPWLLNMAAAFIDDKDEDSVATKRLLAGIKGRGRCRGQSPALNAFLAPALPVD